VVQDLLDLEGHGLAGPHVGDFAEPSIWKAADVSIRLCNDCLAEKKR
jgi:hypothetical protein